MRCCKHHHESRWRWFSDGHSDRATTSSVACQGRPGSWSSWVETLVPLNRHGSKRLKKKRVRLGVSLAADCSAASIVAWRGGCDAQMPATSIMCSTGRWDGSPSSIKRPITQPSKRYCVRPRSARACSCCAMGYCRIIGICWSGRKRMAS
jgi:hypothetical protein